MDQFGDQLATNENTVAVKALFEACYDRQYRNYESTQTNSPIQKSSVDDDQNQGGDVVVKVDSKETQTDLRWSEPIIQPDQQPELQLEQQTSMDAREKVSLKEGSFTLEE